MIVRQPPDTTMPKDCQHKVHEVHEMNLAMVVSAVPLSTAVLNGSCGIDTFNSMCTFLFRYFSFSFETSVALEARRSAPKSVYLLSL
jgi:hypothetical protein